MSTGARSSARRSTRRGTTRLVELPLTPSPPAAAKLRKAGVFSRVDDSSQSIGKRYSRNDELGTPFGITVDFACT